MLFDRWMRCVESQFEQSGRSVVKNLMETSSLSDEIQHEMLSFEINLWKIVQVLG